MASLGYNRRDTFGVTNASLIPASGCMVMCQYKTIYDGPHLLELSALLFSVSSLLLRLSGSGMT